MTAGDPYFLVRVDHHMFWILATSSADDTFQTGNQTWNKLLQRYRNATCVITGIADGDTLVWIEPRLDQPAELNEDYAWQGICEADLITEHDFVAIASVFNGFVQQPTSFPVRAGQCYTTRVHVCGRSEDTYDGSVFTPTERYLIQLWPIDGPADEHERMLLQPPR